jgi:hypothetical protein
VQPSRSVADTRVFAAAIQLSLQVGFIRLPVHSLGKRKTQDSTGYIKTDFWRPLIKPMNPEHDPRKKTVYQNPSAASVLLKPSAARNCDASSILVQAGFVSHRAVGLPAYIHSVDQDERPRGREVELQRRVCDHWVESRDQLREVGDRAGTDDAGKTG